MLLNDDGDLDDHDEYGNDDVDDDYSYYDDDDDENYDKELGKCGCMPLNGSEISSSA